MMDSLTINTPCKINLTLKVGEKRPDGFHDIESVFLALPLYDTLEISAASPADGSFSCAVTMRTEGLPPEQDAFLRAIPAEENIVRRAAFLFHKETGAGLDIRARVTKRIPSGGGLGGASSNAAATLAALERLTRKEAAGIAARAGSDVPFLRAALENELCGCSIGPFCAYTQGRGEKLLPIPSPINPPFWVVLASPGFPSPTPRAYALLDEFRARGEPAPPPARTFQTTPNSFLPAFLALGGEEERSGYARLLEDARAGNPALYGLSGAGSVCFAVFTTEDAAQKARAGLKAAWPWAVCVSV